MTHNPPIKIQTPDEVDIPIIGEIDSATEKVTYYDRNLGGDAECSPEEREANKYDN